MIHLLFPSWEVKIALVAMMGLSTVAGYAINNSFEDGAPPCPGFLLLGLVTYCLFPLGLTVFLVWTTHAGIGRVDRDVIFDSPTFQHEDHWIVDNIACHPGIRGKWYTLPGARAGFLAQYGTFFQQYHSQAYFYGGVIILRKAVAGYSVSLKSRQWSSSFFAMVITAETVLQFAIMPQADVNLWFRALFQNLFSVSVVMIIVLHGDGSVSDSACATLVVLLLSIGILLAISDQVGAIFRDVFVSRKRVKAFMLQKQRELEQPAQKKVKGDFVHLWVPPAPPKQEATSESGAFPTVVAEFENGSSAPHPNGQPVPRDFFMGDQVLHPPANEPGQEPRTSQDRSLGAEFDGNGIYANQRRLPLPASKEYDEDAFQQDAPAWAQVELQSEHQADRRPEAGDSQWVIPPMDVDFKSDIHSTEPGVPTRLNSRPSSSAGSAPSVPPRRIKPEEEKVFSAEHQAQVAAEQAAMAQDYYRVLTPLAEESMVQQTKDRLGGMGHWMNSFIFGPAQLDSLLNPSDIEARLRTSVEPEDRNSGGVTIDETKVLRERIRRQIMERQAAWEADLLKPVVRAPSSGTGEVSSKLSTWLSDPSNKSDSEAGAGVFPLSREGLADGQKDNLKFSLQQSSTRMDQLLQSVSQVATNQALGAAGMAAPSAALPRAPRAPGAELWRGNGAELAEEQDSFPDFFHSQNLLAQAGSGSVGPEPPQGLRSRRPVTGPISGAVSAAGSRPPPPLVNGTSEESNPLAQSLAHNPLSSPLSKPPSREGGAGGSSRSLFV